MALDFLDRLLTVVVTATVTSAAWVVAGSTYFGDDDRGAVAPAADGVESSRSPQGPPIAGASTVATSPPTQREAEQLIVPVQGIAAAQLSDTFTDARGGGSRLHEALDIMAPAGTPVVAAGGGTVEKLFQSDAGGNTVYVRSDDRRTIHYYAHLQGYARGLKEGQKVRPGQALGTVGTSGNANPAAPHLHFAVMRTTPDAEWWEPSTAVNPYPMLVEP